MSSKKEPVQQLATHVEDLHRNYTTLKSQLERVAKDLTTLGFKLGDPLNLTRLPIDQTLIDQVRDALKDGGKNVKSLQKSLGIFDYTEMTRKRKALVAAGVTKETENYQGTNATFIELNEEAPGTGDSGTTDAATPKK